MMRGILTFYHHAMSNLNVVHILWTLGRAGAERMVLDLCRYAKSEGHEPHVIAAGGEGVMKKDFDEAGIPTTALVATNIFQRGKLVKEIAKRLQEIKPDVVHTHLGGDVWGGKAATRLGLHPWVMTAHSHEDDIPFHQRFGRRFAYANADHVAAVSKSVATAIERRYGITKDRVSIIPVGLDLERFRRRERGLPSDIPELISIGRLVPEKGHETLLKALANIEHPFILRLVGHGPEYLRLHRLAESLGILPRVQFHGVVDDVAPLLRKSDIFCFPSRHEGQGVALYEAAAAEVPIIASDLASFRERFDESMMTFVKQDDVDAWTKAIQSMMRDYGMALEKAKRAREEVKLHYTKEAMGEAYFALYRRLIKTAAKRG